MMAARSFAPASIPPLLFVLCVATAPPALPQEVTGNLQGRVLDAEGAPLERVTVTIEGTGLPRPRSVQTGVDGFFRAPALLAGTYTARIRRPGFQAVIVEDIPLRLGRTTVLEAIRLEPVAVELEPVVVTVDRAILDPTSSAIGANLTAETFRDLPVDRSHLSLLPLLPQVNESFRRDAPNSLGATGFENVYYIDGANVTDPHLTQSNATLPYNFVQEVRVQQGGYQAEFGRALGAIVDVVTPSGGDEFHGSAFGFFTNETLAGDPRRGILDASAEGLLNFDAGGSLGGPIVRRRLWFYTAYNANVQARDVPIPGLGLERARRTSHMFAGKLTWQAGENTDVVLSVFGDPTTERVVGNDFVAIFGAPVALANPDPFLADVKAGGYTATTRVRSLLSRHLLLEGTIARSQRRAEDEVAATSLGRTAPLFIDPATGIWEGGRGGYSDTRSVRTSVRAAATLFLRSHALKGGVEYEDNFVDILDATSAPTSSRSVGLIVLDSGPSFIGLYGLNDGEARNRIPTLYLQDSWRVTRRLTINAGMRWEGQYFIGAADSVAQAITNQLQPRLGFIVEPGEPGSHKVFGSVGRYYQQLPLAVAAVVFAGAGEECQHFFSADPRDSSVVPDSSSCLSGVSPKKEGIEGEHFDEFILGYERRLGDGVRMGVRAIHRTLREAYSLGYVDPVFVLGNIGKGELDFLPRPKRNYTALEVTLERTGSDPLQFLASYVLSRAYGNYTGLFASDVDFPVPGNNVGLQLPEQVPNSTGLLPNDRTHVFKLFGSYRFPVGLTAGTAFSLMSGTPLNEFGYSPLLFRPLFLVERGSAGRTPALWDWDVRLTYDLGRAPSHGRYGRVILDIRNIGSPRRAALLDQFRFSPTFGQPLVYQSPMSVRLGFEVGARGR